MKRLSMILGAACLALTAFVPAASAEFGLSSFNAEYVDKDGDTITQAGVHPYEFVVDFSMNLEGPGDPEGSLKRTVTELPPGFIGDPTAVETCEEQELLDDDCPASSQVGVSVVETSGGQNLFTQPIYSMEPQPGLPVRFGFTVLNTAPVRINARAKSEGDYRVVATADNLSEELSVTAVQIRFWGVPADPSHDAERGLACSLANTPPCYKLGGLPAGIPVRPFLSVPTSCNLPLETTMRTTSWQEPDKEVSYAVTQPALIGCDKLSLNPGLNVELTHRVSDTPTGLDVTLNTPQNLSPTGLASAHLKDITVKLPEGTTLNPPAADGQEACSTAQLHLGTLRSPECPNPSKVGTVEIETPLLPETAKGAVFLGTPDDPATATPGAENPFDSLVAIWLVVEAPGVILRVPGEVELDPNTGRVTTTFANNPQLPFETLRMRLFGGPRAALASPPTCGTIKTEADIFTWAAPLKAIYKDDPYEVNQGPNGTQCSSTMASRPFGPKIESGSLVPLAGASSPFIARITRQDGEQEIKQLDVDPPPGLLAKLAGVPYCPDSALSAIQSRSGRAELSSSLCPSASQIGTVQAAAGAGPSPYFVPGKVYLAGPYKGAPLSMAVITPAVTGPFDVGNVVVRVQIRIDKDDAEVHVVSDQLPHIIRGIPLRVRDVRVRLDRPDFVLNPTNCEAMGVIGTATGAGGDLFSTGDDVFARITNPFQVGACGALELKPQVSIRLKGGNRRGDNPALRAVLKAREGDANIERAVAILPRSVFLDQGHIRTICTRVQYAAEACPKGAIYGHARAFTPLLDNPVEGPVYLRSSSNKLPDLVADLNGQVDVDLVARIDSIRGRIRTTFESVPDAPVSKFVLDMQGGKKGLAQNSRNLCRSTAKAKLALKGHNGRRTVLKPKVVPAGCGKAKRGGKRG